MSNVLVVPSNRAGLMDAPRCTTKCYIPTVSVSKENTVGSSALVPTHNSSLHSKFFKILSATLYGTGKLIQTYAFFDDGSIHTLLDQDLAVDIGLGGDPVPLCFQWAGSVTRTEPNSKRVSLSISTSTTSILNTTCSPR